MKIGNGLRAQKATLNAVTAVFAVISLVYVFPVLMVLLNSFKGNTFVKTETFAFLNEENFVGWDNFVKGMTFGGYPFWKSVFYSTVITLLSTGLILLCTSMAAWFISRVDSKFCRAVYYLCVFSMVVPFQMVMFTLSKTADTLKLNTPWTIPVIYLGFGAGLAVFMFVGFVKSIPLEIEEAAAIDGCNPFRTFFSVVLPMMKPTMISVAILEIMWVWNDYLLPYLVLRGAQMQTVMVRLFVFSTEQTVNADAMMRSVVFSMIPPIILFFIFQKQLTENAVSVGIKG